MIKVLFFGPVVERIGKNALEVGYRPGMTLQELRDELALHYPQAFEIVCFFAVNGQHVRDLAMPLADNSEVTFMARFSGG
ncbi:MAG: MoaD/ThiS family protein [Gallionella sp.]|nr:MoaD/ThiS family protein [Gallionella sp.]MDP1942041.1 MoaD/ThiS family protein [Gallionella sp.]